MNEILTPKEAGLYLNVHVRTIYRLAKEGRIPFCKVGGRWRFSKAALEEWFLEDNVQKRGCNKPREPHFQRNSKPTADKADSA
jgi:excisionase family DNA binding protein